jgi:hypothetical protein
MKLITTKKELFLCSYETNKIAYYLFKYKEKYKVNEQISDLLFLELINENHNSLSQPCVFIRFFFFSYVNDSFFFLSRSQ